LRIEKEMIRLHSHEKCYNGKILRNVFRQSKESKLLERKNLISFSLGDSGISS